MKDVLLIDKPAGWTSFDVVAKVRSELRKQMAANTKQQVPTSSVQPPASKKIKVGHAGTLDPFATGLLIILIGDACKKADEFLKLDKTYEFTAKLGEVSSTGDPEGVITPFAASEPKVIRDSLVVGRNDQEARSGRLSDSELESLQKSKINNRKSATSSNIQPPNIDEVHHVLSQFTGKITQTPPAYSAIKVNGKRAYKLAREGKEVEIPARKVTVYRLEVTGYEYPYLKCVCDVSSGTYIRSLAEDIGKALGVGAYCYELRRTRVGDMEIDGATKLVNGKFSIFTP